MYVTRSFTCCHWKERKKEILGSTMMRKHADNHRSKMFDFFTTQDFVIWVLHDRYGVTRVMVIASSLVWFSAYCLLLLLHVLFYFFLLLRLTDIRRQKNTIISFFLLFFCCYFFFNTYVCCTMKMNFWVPRKILYFVKQYSHVSLRQLKEKSISSKKVFSVFSIEYI